MLKQITTKQVYQCNFGLSSERLEEFNELQSGKIKKSPEKDNPEITSEDLQDSEVLHSIGSEKI